MSRARASRWRVRAVVNLLNASTPLGLLLARAAGARLERGPRRTWLAGGYRWPVPAAPAFTVGSVVCTRHDVAWLRARPRLLAHEDRHCTQYAWCAGPAMIPLYLLSAGVSWAATGDPATLNPFERHAGLRAGGYVARPLRWHRTRTHAASSIRTE